MKQFWPRRINYPANCFACRKPIKMGSDRHRIAVDPLDGQKQTDQDFHMWCTPEWYSGYSKLREAYKKGVSLNDVQ